MPHRISPQAETDLDDIWYYIASESGNPDIADRLIDSFTRRFLLLARYPHIGRSRSDDLRNGLRSFALGKYVIFYRCEVNHVLILRIIHGSRDLPNLLDT